MRPLLLLALLGLIVMVMAIPADLEDQPYTLLDFADAGDVHSNDADRLVRHGGYRRGGWGGGYRRGWGGGHRHGWRGGHGHGHGHRHWG